MTNSQPRMEVDLKPLSEHTFAKFVDNKQQVWDASSLSTFTRCPRLYKMGNIDGWTTKTESAAPLFGKAVHYGLELLEYAKFNGATKDEAVHAAVKGIVDEYGAGLQEIDDAARGLEAALRIPVWRAEDEYHSGNVRTAVLPDGKPALETRFECPIPGVDALRFSGRIDRIAEFGERLYIVDLKTTTSSLSSYYFERYNPNTQIYAYLWAVRRVLGIPVAGFIIDAIQSGVNFCRFGRQVFNVTDSQLDEWMDHVVLALNQAEDYYEDGDYPTNFNSCGAFGGCRFKDVCSRPPEHRQAWLDEDYVQKPYGTRIYTQKEMDV